MTSGRLLFDAPRSGPWNMAVDQVMLEEVNRGQSPVLRFYRWARPTLSLGYFQRATDRGEHPDSKRADLVRRTTGGGAILHDAELTYSLCVPIGDRTSARVRNIYDQVHGAIAAALADFGVVVGRFADSDAAPPSGAPEPFLCFQRRSDEDLVLRGYKIVGSAQRRAARAVLQHGSILLAASRLAPQLPGVLELASTSVPEEVLAQRVTHHLGLAMNIAWAPLPAETLPDQEIQRIVRDRFAAASWTAKR